MLGIIAAMEEELDTVRAFLRNAEKKQVCGRTFYTDGRIVAALSGIGKVNAALCAQTMILSFGVSKILNIGSAGGLIPGMRPGDLVIADGAAQHDLFVFSRETNACGCDKAMVEELFPLAGDRAYRGIVVSGDHFIDKAEEKAALVSEMGATACDMEAAAVGWACRMANVPFAVVRGISDCADEDARLSFAQCLKLASERAAAVALAYVQNGNC